MFALRWFQYLTRIFNSHNIAVSTINYKIFWNIRKNRTFQQRTGSYKKNQMENVELKNITTEMMMMIIT